MVPKRQRRVSVCRRSCLLIVDYCTKTGTDYTFTYSFENNADKPSYFKLKGAQSNIELKSIVCTYTCAESTGYYSITDADTLKTALTTGKRAKLESDVTITDTLGATTDTAYVGTTYYRFAIIPAGVKTYIDLNGHTINFKYGSGKSYENMTNGVNGILINANASLTVNDTSKTHAGAIVFNGDESTNWFGALYLSPTINALGNLTLLNGTIENSTETNVPNYETWVGPLQYAVDVNSNVSDASITINGDNALVKADHYGAIRLFANSTYTAATFNMFKGNIWAARTGVWIQNPFGTSKTGDAYCTKANMNITGGTIHGEKIGFYSETYPDDVTHSSESGNTYRYNFTGGTIENNEIWSGSPYSNAPMAFGMDYYNLGVGASDTNYIRTMINKNLTLKTITGNTTMLVYSSNRSGSLSAADANVTGKTA
jgi:hypothetical protein